jgi:hypothetical protein
MSDRRGGETRDGKCRVAARKPLLEKHAASAQPHRERRLAKVCRGTFRKRTSAMD